MILIVAKTGPNKRYDLVKLEQALGVRFNNRALLQQATIHRSYLNEQENGQVEDYERLEFLGDAFLGWVVAQELFERYPAFTEGDLTRSRASLVRGTTLAKIAERIGVGKHLVLGSGEEATGGRERRSTLAAMLEALLGAVLLDHGDKEARRLALDWLNDAINSLDPRGAPRDAKSSLQEACQKHGFALPIYQVTNEEGPSHNKRFTVEVVVDGAVRGSGDGERKIEAEQDAAENALAWLGNGY